MSGVHEGSVRRAVGLVRVVRWRPGDGAPSADPAPVAGTRPSSTLRPAISEESASQPVPGHLMSSTGPYAGALSMTTGGAFGDVRGPCNVRGPPVGLGVLVGCVRRADGSQYAVGVAGLGMEAGAPDRLAVSGRLALVAATPLPAWPRS
ncbi:hypothetical protein [Streptomyces sp. NPDC002550]